MQLYRFVGRFSDQTPRVSSYRVACLIHRVWPENSPPTPLDQKSVTIGQPARPPASKLNYTNENGVRLEHSKGGIEGRDPAHVPPMGPPQEYPEGACREPNRDPSWVVRSIFVDFVALFGPQWPPSTVWPYINRSPKHGVGSPPPHRGVFE